MNEKKYPVDKARGNNKKYTEFQGADNAQKRQRSKRL